VGILDGALPDGGILALLQGRAQQPQPGAGVWGAGYPSPLLNPDPNGPSLPGQFNIPGFPASGSNFGAGAQPVPYLPGADAPSSAAPPAPQPRPALPQQASPFGTGTAPFSFAGPGSLNFPPSQSASPASTSARPVLASDQAPPIAVGNYMMPRIGKADDFESGDETPANAAPTDVSSASRRAPLSLAGPAASPKPASPSPSAFAPAPASPGVGDRLALGAKGFLGNMSGGPVGALLGGLGALVTGQPSDAGSIQAGYVTQTAKSLLAANAPPEAVKAAVAQMAMGNREPMNALYKQYFGTKDIDNLGQGYIRDKATGKITRAYEPDDKTPTSVLEYQFYRQNLPQGQQPMPYDVWSTAKARAGATSIANNIDVNGAQSYDKQLAEGLGKSHAALSNGVEDAQSRARDIAAMQGAIDAIQKNGGSTGGLAPAARLELQKSINAGAAALGIERPFSEADLSDKEFLTKFNRSMAGAQAKGAVGSRVTNFEMSNFLKANPGLDMTVTGNQRLLGIQAQIEQRNIAVGNAIRQATAQAISDGKRIDPVTVQRIVADYDEAHHVKDPITGQDLTQSYVLPEFQNANPSNANLSDTHTQNLSRMEKTVGNRTAVTTDGGKTWFWKDAK
jgi:hypothetical protein